MAEYAYNENPQMDPTTNLPLVPEGYAWVVQPPKYVDYYYARVELHKSTEVETLSIVGPFWKHRVERKTHTMVEVIAGHSIDEFDMDEKAIRDAAILIVKYSRDFKRHFEPEKQVREDLYGTYPPKKLEK